MRENVAFLLLFSKPYCTCKSKSVCFVELQQTNSTTCNDASRTDPPSWTYPLMGAANTPSGVCGSFFALHLVQVQVSRSVLTNQVSSSVDRPIPFRLWQFG